MVAVIILPTYNERDNIEKIISVLEEKIFSKITKHTMHILVADDNSPDGTGDVVKALMKKYTNLHLLQGEKEGLGAAYLRAMDEAIKKLNADIVFEMDADLSHDPTKIPLFLEKIDQGYDMVIGNRYSDGGSIPANWAFMRKVYSTMANLIIRIILTRFAIHDWTGGYRALKKEVFLKERHALKGFSGYTFQTAFLHKALQDGYKVAEVPFHFIDRTDGVSKIASGQYIRDLLKYVFTARIQEIQRFIKFLFVGGTGFFVQLLAQELAVLIGVPNPIAVGIGAEAAILSNFMFNHLWTFHDTQKVRQNSNTFIKLAKFNMTSVGAILVQVLAVAIGEKMVGTSVQLGNTIIPTRLLIVIPTIVFVVVPLNYFIYNKIIWKTQYLHDKTTPNA